MLEVQDGRLWVDGALITQDTELSCEMVNVIEEKVEEELRETYKMTKFVLPKTEEQKFHQDTKNYSYWIWKRNSKVNINSRHLVLISGSKRLALPGIWSDVAYTGCHEKQGTQFQQIQSAIDDKTLLYETISVFHIGKTETEEQKHDAEQLLRCILLHIVRSEHKKDSEVDVICSGYAGVCLYKFISRCPPFATNRLGSLIMLDSQAQLQRDLSSLSCNHEQDSIIPIIKERATNIVSENVESAPLYKIAQTVGCDCISTGLSSDLVTIDLNIFIFAMLRDKITEKRIFRLRTILITFLFIICIIFGYVLRNLK